MGVQYLLYKSLSFILNLYDFASAPFFESQRKMQAQGPPFVETYFEDDESPYLEEWMAAEESNQVIGQSCISIPSAALRLYVQITINQRGGDTREVNRNKGWLKGCKECFGREFDLDFLPSEADLELVEEITLARNRLQHPEAIASCSPAYSKADLKKISNVFFLSDIERAMLSDSDEIEPNWIFQPNVHVDREELATAIEEVRNFADRLEPTG